MISFPDLHFPDIMCFMNGLCVYTEFLHLPCERPHEGEDMAPMTMKGSKQNTLEALRKVTNQN